MKSKELIRSFWAKIHRVGTTILGLVNDSSEHSMNHEDEEEPIDLATIRACPAMAMQARNPLIRHTITKFDTDSALIGVDNRCSACISDKTEDFEGPLRDTNRVVRGIGGIKIGGIKTGTLKWRWLDDDGKEHAFTIPNSYYVPGCGVRLLSPQHWAQKNKALKASEQTDHEKCILRWGSLYKLTIPLNEVDNVATFCMPPGFDRFTAFCAEAGLDYNDVVCLPCDLTADAKEDDEKDEDPGVWRRNMEAWADATPAEYDAWVDTPHVFNLNGDKTKEAPHVVTDEEDRLPNHSAELLRLHQDYNHISFRKLQWMAKQGTLPKRLANCNIPTCSACLYGKATRRQWRQKTRRNVAIDEPTRPGQVVAVDQMVSATPGLIAQMTGKLTKERYRCATVYVDMVSRLTFVYLQKGASAAETIAGKKAFEAFAARRGVKICGYHADNGIFKAKDWVDECRKCEQTLTFAGVDAHHQNGMAERKIRELQEMARSMLIHASKRWDKTVTAALWPYAVRMATYALNETPSFQDGKDEPQSRSSRIRKSTRTRNIGSLSDAPSTFSIGHSERVKSTGNGNAAQRKDCTWAHLPSTIGMWPWYSTSTPVMSVRNFT